MRNVQHTHSTVSQTTTATTTTQAIFQQECPSFCGLHRRDEAAALRHERLSVAGALAEKLHHTSRSQRFARTGGRGARGARCVTTTEAPSFFGLFDEEGRRAGGPARVGHGPCTAWPGAAHIEDIVPVRSDPRRSCAADGG